MAIIEQSLARKNDLHVGDTIEIANYWSPNFPEYYRTYPPVEIVGIYAYPDSADYDTTDYASTQPGNIFFTDFEASTLFFREFNPDWQGYATSVRVYLTDPADAGSFIADAETWLDMEKYELISDAEWYQYAAGAIEQVGAVTKTVVGIAVLVGVAVFLLVGGVSLLGRKRELGILMSMGERKARICGQLLIESVVPVFLAIVVGLCAGEPAARMVSRNMLDDAAGGLQEELETYKDKEGDPLFRFRMADTMTSHGADGLQIDTALSLQPMAKTQALFFLCMLAFALLSVLVQTVYVVRVQPVKLLIKRE